MSCQYRLGQEKSSQAKMGKGQDIFGLVRTSQELNRAGQCGSGQAKTCNKKLETSEIIIFFRALFDFV